MNRQGESLDDLERRLKKCVLAPVSPALMNQLRNSMPVQPVMHRPSWRFHKGLLAIAATIIFCCMVGLWSLNKTGVQTGAARAPLPADRLTVKSADTYFVGVRKLGIWSAADGRAYKVVQGVTMNQTVIQNSRNGSELKMIEPQQQVLLVAMATQ